MVKKKGTDAADLLKGSGTADNLLGLAGSDTIKGFDAGDTISGGDGKDKLFGGDGDDILYGHSKADLRQSNSLIQSKVVADIGDRPVQVTTAPGDDGFLYGLTEHNGIVYRIDAATGDKTKFLDIPDSDFSRSPERGVLGLAFDPDYAKTGRFFVYLTNADGNIEIREYHHTDGHAKADPDPVQTIMTIPHPDFENHNGGSMVFGPDGYLYIGTGDGGSSGDPNGNAQNKDSLLGKILRIDINGDDFASDTRNYAIPDDNAFVGKNGADEIWAMGLRNPWRFSFDTNGDLYIGDVGQNEWEEIDYVKAGTKSGLNFGWNYREGLHAYTGTPPNPHAFTDPVFEYSHNGGNAAVTGGVVYHGDGGLNGAYFFNDFVTGAFYTLRMVNGKPVDVIERTDQIHGAPLTSISDYGVDEHGNLYATSLDGRILLITPGKSAGDGADEMHGGGGADKMYGGAGNDRMFGDEGSDRLDGGIGNDKLAGGAGADTFVFKTGTGHDVIRDFETGSGSGHDVIDLSHFAGISGFADLMAHHLTEKGGNVIIESGDDRVVLEGVAKGDLHRQDFDFG